jgi:hypothetical protein
MSLSRLRLLYIKQLIEEETDRTNGLTLKQISDHLKEKKWLDRCFVVVWDEPYRSVYPQIAKTTATIVPAAAETSEPVE